jgi:hypothetical protein
MMVTTGARGFRSVRDRSSRSSSSLGRRGMNGSAAAVPFLEFESEIRIWRRALGLTGFFNGLVDRGEDVLLDEVGDQLEGLAL